MRNETESIPRWTHRKRKQCWRLKFPKENSKKWIEYKLNFISYKLIEKQTNICVNQ